MGPSPASPPSQHGQTAAPAMGPCWEPGVSARGQQGCCEERRGGRWFLHCSNLSFPFCSGSAVVGSSRDSPARAGTRVKVHARAEAGNAWMTPGRGVQGQDQPGGQRGAGQGDPGPVQVLQRTVPPRWQKAAGGDLQRKKLSRRT